MRKVKAIFLLMILIGLGGCVKYDVGMTVGPDKSFAIEIIMAIIDDVGEGATNEEDLKTLQDKGYTYKEYNEKGWIGYRLNRQYDNIDDVSVGYELSVELTDLLDPEKDTKVFFQKKTSLFKTTYVANFTVDLTDDSGLEVNGTDINYDALSGMELDYRVALPVKSDKQNATEVSANGKNLTWELEYGVVNNINYEFSMFNNTLYYIGGGIILIGILMMLSGFKNNRKLKKLQRAEEKNEEDNGQEGIGVVAIEGPIELGTVPVNNADMPVVEPSFQTEEMPKTEVGNETEEKGQSGHIPFTGFNVGNMTDEANDGNENKM